MRVHTQGRMRTAGAIALAVLAVGIAFPSRSAAEEVDRIAAVVGSEIILLSELDEEVYLAHLRDQLDLEDEKAVDAYRHEVLDGAVEGKLLLEEARRQGLRVSREEVESAIDGMMQEVRGRFPTEEAFERQLAQEGSSVEDLRRGYRSRIEEQLLVRQLVDRTVRSRVSVSEKEVRDYWDEHRDQVPDVPELLHLRRILISLSATASADSAAVERMKIVRSRLESGEDFATLARVFSEGPAASAGGRLGWFDVDDLEPVLADAVRGKSEGYVTPVLVTDRGAHVLRVGAHRDAGQVELSQIVFLRDEEAARAAARARAEAIRARLAAGEDFAKVAEAESDDPVTRSRGGDLGSVPIEALSPEYRTALSKLQEGEVSGVIEADDGFVIFRLDGREGARAPTYEEMSDRIQAILEQEKGKTYYDDLVEQARASTYVDLRLDTEG